MAAHPFRVPLVLAAAVAAGACSNTPADTTAADLEAINALRTAYASAFNDDDPDRLAALYTEDAVRMEDNRPATTGRGEILAAFREQAGAFDSDMALKSEETIVTGDWAFDRGQYMLHLMPRGANTADMVMDQGKYLVVIRRQADGSWQIAREIGNSNVPLPPPAAPPASAGPSAP